jgi:curved DNA-binding protein CbpA
MNYKIALEILEIEMSDKNYNDINLNLLKKQYHKLALQNHPDKNGNTDDSKQQFQKINDAYEFLKREINITNYDENENEEATDFFNSSTVYGDILNSFLSDIFQGKYNRIFYEIIKNIIIKKVPNNLFKKINKKMALDIYNFLSKYKNEFHLNDDILDMLVEIIHKKHEVDENIKDDKIHEDNTECYKLNPSIDDLFENNLYKLYVNQQLCLVPLWHNELYFEGSEENDFKEIVVFCEPELPKNIIIDENNDLHIRIEYDIINIINLIKLNKDLFFNIGKKIISIPINKLYMKENQFYKIKNAGLSKIKEDNIYDITEKSDVIINLVLV